MIEAFLGILIASMATLSLLISLSISSKVFKNAGREPLSNKEKEIIKNAGYNDSDIMAIEIDLKNIKLK